MNKSIHCLLTLLTIFFLTFCKYDKKDETESKIFNMDTIKVGMTYDEVEKILNKPKSIVRGVNELIRSDNQLAVIDNYGTLLYVVWVYNLEKIDRGSFQYKSHKLNVDTIYYTEDRYYQGGREITKERYDRILASRENQFNDSLLSKQGKSASLEVQKKSFNKHRINSRIDIDAIYQVNYSVINNLSVIFDASSGRVVDRKYMPIIVVPKDTIDIKNKLLKEDKKIS